MAQRSIVQQGLICAFALSGLAGCGTFSTVMEPTHIDYKSANQATPSTPKLEVPPDLTQLQHDNRYQVPTSGVTSANEYGHTKDATAATVATANSTVAVNKIGSMHIERDGNAHWLVVQQSPEVLWPQVKDFWQESGFLIDIEKPTEGIMETDWAENRAKIPSDFLRDTLGKVLDSLWSTGQRDKFRTRMERGPNGTTEIYISHQGVEEVLVGATKDTTSWQPRPVDPGLEMEFLGRMMGRLSNDPKLAKEAVADAAVDQPHSKLVKAADGNTYVEVDEGFDHAWRRVGLALDRVGFTVEDRDRSQGTYFVRYVDENKTNDKGFLSNLFSFGKDDDSKALKYRITVTEANGNSKVVVLNNDGKPEVSDTASKILSLLNDQLK